MFQPGCIAGRTPRGFRHRLLSPDFSLRDAHRDRASSSANKRGDGGAPVSDRHRPPGGGRNRVPPTEQNAGTAWSAGLRPASTAGRRSKPRTPTEQKRADGLERRSPTGIDRREAVETAYPQLRKSAGTAWNAGLRPASRGSAKPAPMMVRSVRVSAAPSPRQFAVSNGNFPAFGRHAGHGPSPHSSREYEKRRLERRHRTTECQRRAHRPNVPGPTTSGEAGDGF